MYRFRSKLLTFGQIHTSLNKQAHTEDDILSMDSSWWLFLNKLIIVKMGVNDMVKTITFEQSAFGKCCDYKFDF
jgi:hypothetical protein